ncbi:TROVE domain-containing protein [Tautonia sociabilis]|uniref:TROVE domain-containing protein n=1 Tax=Tautonia sociabilis TaxID=2080755 RepID=A0A432MFA7_9BACT|nr:TROVE domain-containing protein [Tautonia sociabilis]RUL84679.1 TROVE domain-containing protein [Tautonia sociabilis]
MVRSFLKHVNIRRTPQREPIPGSVQVPNSAGGFAFPVDDWTRLERFLILGSEGGSYDATERTLTIENAGAVIRCLEADPVRTIRSIVQVSESGRAPKNDPAVLALAIAAGMGHTEAASAALPKVCRTGTHLFTFAEAVQGLRGWGRGLRRGVASWYEGKPIDAIAYQVAKYRSRSGWSHRDLLRLAHPTTGDPARQAVYRWVVGGAGALGPREVARGGSTASYPDVSEHLPRLLAATDEARTADRATVIRLIREDGLPRECIPTEHLNDPEVWEALLEAMPMTAMVRNLAKMTSIGLLTPGSIATRTVRARLADGDQLRKARLHPLAVLIASSTYARGAGLKGGLSWEPVKSIGEALDNAFLLAFGSVSPANKRTLIGLDVSGSMGFGRVAGSPLTPREASAALAMVMVRTEPECRVMAFQSKFEPFPIGNRERLADVVRRAEGLPFGGTDCSLPMVEAMRKGWPVDTFVVLTDSETWAGAIHPVQALREYRRATGIPARLIVVGMVSNGFTIADPDDAGMLDVVGFDASAPEVMNGFSRGDL